jgi:TolB-like protein/DNA-binding winged helix-turn-helix (wHTH) protein
MQFRIADLVLDPGRRELTRNGQSIELGRLTYSLLLELVRSAPNVVTHEELVQRLWRGRTTSPETVTQRVKLLRDALGDDADQPRYVGLVRGHGYRLMPPVETLGSPPADKPDSVIEPSGGRRRRLPYLGFALVCVIVTATGLAFWRSYGTGDQPAAPKLAVLPCENLSPDPNDLYFAQGLHWEILYRVGKLSGLRVVSRTSALKFADPAERPPVAEIARTLGVQYVMECSVRYADDQILVNAQLVDPKTDVPVFSDRYLANLNDLDAVFARQADIALRIARELGAEYSPGEQARIARVPTVSRDAWALYLRALSQRDEAAIGMLEEAIRHDEDFALAHGALAMRYAFSLINTTYGPAQSPGRRDVVAGRVGTHARHAIALNADAPDAYTALGVLDFVTWRWTDAEVALKQAVELGPTTPVISWHYYGHLLSQSGRHDEAIALAERARELEPGDAKELYAFELGYAGQHGAAAAVFEEVIDAAPDDYLLWHWLAFMEIGRGNANAAPGLIETAEKLAAPMRPIGFLGPWAYAYWRAGRRDDAARIFEEIRQAENAGTPPGAGGWTMAYLAKGDQASALESLELAAQKAANHEPDEGLIILLALKSNVTNDPVLRQREFVNALALVRGN